MNRMVVLPALFVGRSSKRYFDLMIGCIWILGVATLILECTERTAYTRHGLGMRSI
jgi:hypothetical protein